MILKRKKINPKLSVLKLMSKVKFSSLKPTQRIAYANLGVEKVSDLSIICELSFTKEQLLDYADEYKQQGKTHLARFGNRWATIVLSGGGPVSMEFNVMSLIFAGAKKIIHAGVCGSLKDRIKIGDLVAADSVYINDDTSRAHTKEEIISCENEMFEFLKSEVKKIIPPGINLHFSRVVSGSTLFGQTKLLLSSWAQLGDVTNLESATCFAICKEKGIECIGIFAVVDDKLNDMDIFTMNNFPMDKIFDNGDFLLRALVQGIKDYNLGKNQ